MCEQLILHYDALVDENNDPVRDPEPLRAYMDKWDGENFIMDLQLSDEKSVLEIGFGTGRLAVRVAPDCGRFAGIDISPKTVKRAYENLAEYKNVELICGDFLTYDFEGKFDVVYSSLTFMHFEDKETALKKAASLLNPGGRFVLSIDKNRDEYIDFGTRKVKIYPDKPEEILRYMENAGFIIEKQYETEFACIFAGKTV